ncbi:MAG: alpha/beta fold hydrolase [Pseudomonadota bacterium]
MTRATWGSDDLGGLIGTLSAGAKLRVARWSGPADGPGTVILVQGRAEFIEFYGETVADLLARGFSVITFDFRGQGGSVRRTRKAGHVSRFKNYEDDLLAVVRYAVQSQMPGPYTVLAHSMGGLVALRAQPALAATVSRMVLLAPMLDIVELPLPKPLIRALAWGASMVGLSRTAVSASPPPPTPAGFAGNRLTTDEARYARLCKIVADNPDLTTGVPTFGWMRAALSATAKIAQQQGEPLPIPTLFVASGADRIVSTPAIDAFAKSAPGGGLVLVRGARHQILFERDERRNLFFAAFDAFVTEQAKETPAKNPRPSRPVPFEVGAQSDRTPQLAPLPTAPTDDAAPAAARAEPMPEPGKQAEPERAAPPVPSRSPEPATPPEPSTTPEATASPLAEPAAGERQGEAAAETAPSEERAPAQRGARQRRTPEERELAREARRAERRSRRAKEREEAIAQLAEPAPTEPAQAEPTQVEPAQAEPDDRPRRGRGLTPEEREARRERRRQRRLRGEVPQPTEEPAEEPAEAPAEPPAPAAATEVTGSEDATTEAPPRRGEANPLRRRLRAARRR